MHSPLFFFRWLLMRKTFLNIIFYLLPALVSGLVIGVTYRLKLNGIYILLAITLINLLANYAIIPVLDHLYQINFIQYALGLVGLGSHPLANACFHDVSFYPWHHTGITDLHGHS